MKMTDAKYRMEYKIQQLDYDLCNLKFIKKRKKKTLSLSYIPIPY